MPTETCGAALDVVASPATRTLTAGVPAAVVGVGTTTTLRIAVTLLSTFVASAARTLTPREASVAVIGGSSVRVAVAKLETSSLSAPVIVTVGGAPAVDGAV